MSRLFTLLRQHPELSKMLLIWSVAVLLIVAVPLTYAIHKGYSVQVGWGLNSPDEEKEPLQASDPQNSPPDKRWHAHGEEEPYARQ